MLYSISFLLYLSLYTLFICFLSCPTFPSKFALFSSRKTIARSIWNYKTMCLMVSVRGRLLFWQCDLLYWDISRNGRQHGIAASPCCYSRDLVIALRLQTHDATTSQPIRLLLCWCVCLEFFVKNALIVAMICCCIQDCLLLFTSSFLSLTVALCQHHSQSP